MNRYFLEVSYLGTGYAGYQVQRNAITIQGEVEKAMRIYFRRDVVLTGSSRTDALVHAAQNFFHFDWEVDIDPECVYNLNALLPAQVAVRSLRKMRPGAHCRFDAVSRQYRYIVYRRKNPFLSGLGYYYPYALDGGRLMQAAGVIGEYGDFRSFAKRNAQVNTYTCRIMDSYWVEMEGHWEYHVKANRFLRGMVRGLVGTMLQVGRGKMSVEEFREVIVGGDSGRVDFSIPGYGLYLENVAYPAGYFS